MTIEDPHLTYRQLDGSIHSFTFHRANRKALDAFGVKLAEIFAQHPPDECILFYVDLRPDGLPPVTYSLRTLRRIFGEIGKPPTIFAAYLYESSLIMSLLGSFMDTLRLGATRRLFHGDKDDEAIEWLLEMQRDFRRQIVT
ncbi:MAG: hypothetical protein ACOCYT_00100 [Chloroflexota bacterium]